MERLTDPERLPRWFAPVTGELRLGGRFQVEGNAGGEVLACDAPHRFEVTWEFDGGVSWVEVRLTPDPAGGTRLTLEHSAIPGGEHWDTYGPGAVGIGWELALMGMELHVASGGAADPAEGQAWAMTPEAAGFMVGSGTAWGEADAASGTDPAAARAKAERTNAAYTAPPEA